MRVEMGGIRRQHDLAAPGLHAHALQALGVAADMVDGDPRHDLVLAVMEVDAAGKDLAHHRHHVVDLERHAQRRVAHAAPRGIGHLAVLQVVARAGKQVVVANVIVMHVADDDGPYLRGVDADRFQSLADRLDHFALALLAHGRVEPGIEDDGAGASDNGPNVEIERLQHVMGVAADEVFRCLAIMMPVANGIDFVDVVAHWSSPSGMRAARGQGARRAVRRVALGTRGRHFGSGLPARGARTSTPARRSTGCTTVVRSLSGPFSSQAVSRSCVTASATCIGTPSALPSPRHSLRSLVINPTVKPRLKVRGSTTRPNLSSVAVLRPVPELITSSMMRGSSPALTPMTIASDVAVMAAAERKLLQSFMVCPAPGRSLMKKILPIAASAGSMALTSARGPEAINASVPFVALVTPPLTGQSICTMFRPLSVSKIRLAITAPVVDRSTKRRTRLPSITPPGPVATASTTSGVGRLTITVSTASATSRGEPAACAPSAMRRSMASRRVSNTTRRWPASTSRRAMGKPIWPSPMKPISIVVPPSMRRFGPLPIYHERAVAPI